MSESHRPHYPRMTLKSCACKARLSQPRSESALAASLFSAQARLTAQDPDTLVQLEASGV